jgi:hypothetical protein
MRHRAGGRRSDLSSVRAGRRYNGEIMFRRLMLFSAFFCCIAEIPLISQRTTPVIRQVDHILVEAHDPKALFSLFSDPLQLPVAWPFTENDEYVTGGIGTGNLNLEFFLYPRRRISETNFYGIAFEPYPLADALRRLKSLGIPYSPPETAISDLPNGTRGVAWTTVGLPTLSKPEMSLFLYEYSPEYLRVDVRRKQLGNRLKLNNGGPLGIQSLCEIVISTTRLQEDREVWGKLLGKSAGTAAWSAGGGVVIRLAQGNKNRIHQIAFKVSSLERARAFLKKNRLLGADAPKRLSLNSSKIQGLKIFLTEAP